MPATTIAAVIDELDKIVSHAIATGNRTGYFAALYKRVTVAVAGKIKQGGYFDDDARMEKLDVIFANRYLDAYNDYMQGKPCTTSWKLAFDTAKTWKPMVLHHLLTGMNAHISLDLGIAAATVAPGNNINNIYNDFLKINNLLNDLTNDVKLDLFSMWPLSRLTAGLNAGKFENSIAGFSMQVARDAAWQVALAYAPLDTADKQTAYTTTRDADVCRFGNTILNPGAWASTVMYVLRIFEFGTTASKIERLNRKIN